MWKLCEQVKKQNPNELSKCYAVFVSNERRTVPLWRQKAGRGEDKLVVWVSRFAMPATHSQLPSASDTKMINLYSKDNRRC